jgi:hypothetical protein
MKNYDIAMQLNKVIPRQIANQSCRGVAARRSPALSCCVEAASSRGSACH